jgi:FHA domain
MQGKNHTDDASKGSAVNREVKANEATRVIDDNGLPPQPGPVPRQAAAVTAPADGGLAANRPSLQEQTRIESPPQPQTRFIGAYAAEASAPAPQDKKMMAHASPAPSEQAGPVVGWLVVVAGPGRGRFRPIGEGSNPIGRAPSQRIPLDFGDDAISSEKQAYLIYDPQQRDFLLVPNLERSNLVSLNGTRVTGAMPLKPGDLIAMGQSKLYFQPLCGPNFDWSETNTPPVPA